MKRYVEFFVESSYARGDYWPALEIRRYEENELGERSIIGRQSLQWDGERYVFSEDVAVASEELIG